MKVRRVLAAPDKFKGTATARDVAAAMGHGVWDVGYEVVEQPLSDGGDGLLDVLGGANRALTVVGPLGDPVVADWRMDGGVAVIEMARASGLVLVGGAEGNDPLGATTAGTGQIIEQALNAGAQRVIVGLGGSAPTDGGYGAIRAISGVARLKNVELLVACDVTTRFAEAAVDFGPQKGASPAQVKLLTGRLSRLLQIFSEEFGVDIADLPGGGAAGGLGGALAALGGRLVPGFDLVANEVDLYSYLDVNSMDRVDLVVTGEGYLDRSSLRGKVVGGVCQLAVEADVPVLVVVGSADAMAVHMLKSQPGLRVDVVELVEAYGLERSVAEPKACTTEAVAQWLSDSPYS